LYHSEKSCERAGSFSSACGGRSVPLSSKIVANKSRNVTDHSQRVNEVLQKLIATHENDCAFQIAEVYAYRGEADKAFQWLNHAFQQRDPGAPELKTAPR
jgi:hypothetical protein